MSMNYLGIELSNQLAQRHYTLKILCNIEITSNGRNDPSAYALPLQLDPDGPVLTKNHPYVQPVRRKPLGK